ncbi:hypothetical protein GGF42_001081 [Coemansia sp. RSA 2424]|nr:hypothetical protein GGF42_001081 [Coemansia sp. RSA 2424]
MDFTYFVLLLAVAFAIGYAVYQLYLSPYRRIPSRLLYRLSPLPSRLDALLGRLADACERDYYALGDIYLTGPGIVIISHPDDCRAVLSTHRFLKNKYYQAFALIEDNIYTTQSPELANLRRRQLKHTFSHAYLDRLEPVILKSGVTALMRRWDRLLACSADGVIVQYETEFARLAIDVIVVLGYGQNLDTMGTTYAQIAKWVHDYNVLSMANLVLPLACTQWPFTLLVESLLQSKNDFVASISAAAATRRDHLQNLGNGEQRPTDILQALLDGEDPESLAKMTATQVVAENIAIIVASTDIVAQTLTWTVCYLMLYPEAYRKATGEVRRIFPRSKLVTYADAKTRLPYIEACVYEAMRIRAATGVFLPRIVPKGGATFQGHFLPEGTELGINVAGANHHKGTWENPRRFVPERFIDNERSRLCLFTFSLGARMCPGKNLALFEILPAIANLLKNYDFALPSNSLFTPSRLDEHGNPIVMPRSHRFTSVGPKYPDRDCQIIVSKALSLIE